MISILGLTALAYAAATNVTAAANNTLPSISNTTTSNTINTTTTSNTINTTTTSNITSNSAATTQDTDTNSAATTQDTDTNPLASLVPQVEQNIIFLDCLKTKTNKTSEIWIMDTVMENLFTPSTTQKTWSKHITQRGIITTASFVDWNGTFIFPPLLMTSPSNNTLVLQKLSRGAFSLFGGGDIIKNSRVGVQEVNMTWGSPSLVIVGLEADQSCRFIGNVSFF